MPARVTLSGTWKFGPYAGTLWFTGGPRDDYLELRPDGMNWPETLKNVDLSLPGDLSLKSFADGQGLGILRLLIGGESSHDQLAGERMATLTELLAHTVLPDLRWEHARLVLAAVPTLNQQVDTPFGCTGSSIRQERAEESVGVQDEDRLEQASLAVERGQFGHAERSARQAQSEGDPAAAGFLDALTRVRKTTRVLRRYPRDARAHLELGWALLVTGAAERAQEAAHTALKLDPGLGCAHALLGMEMLVRGDDQGARSAYDAARASTAEDDHHIEALAAALRGEPPGPGEAHPDRGFMYHPGDRLSEDWSSEGAERRASANAPTTERGNRQPVVRSGQAAGSS